MRSDMHIITNRSHVIFVVTTMMLMTTLGTHSPPVGGATLTSLKVVYNDNCDNGCKDEPSRF